MIEELVPRKLKSVNREDFGLNGGNAYDAAKVECEVYNFSDVTLWKDEETGELLFTEYCNFEPGMHYFDDGQGEWHSSYQAHFKLKPGQTDEEAFHERQALDEQKKLQKEASESLSPEARETLEAEIENLKQQAKQKFEEEIEPFKRKALHKLNKEINSLMKKTIADDKRDRIEKSKEQYQENQEKQPNIPLQKDGSSYSI